MKDPEIALARAKRADQILNDPLFKEAVTAIKASLFSGFSEMRLFRVWKSLEIWLTMKCLDSLLRMLEREIKNGKLAEELIKKENQRQRKLARSRR